MTARLPKSLRRLATVQSSYSFCGYPLRPGMAEEWPPNIPIRDERDGTYINRVTDLPLIPRCLCGRPVPASSSCGCCCAEHDSRAASITRHPAGKGLPQ